MLRISFTLKISIIFISEGFTPSEALTFLSAYFHILTFWLHLPLARADIYLCSACKADNLLCKKRASGYLRAMLLS